ncbi:MAG: metallophosphatase family protein, partial [Euryarchaeota archaeon]|nr:metallophosphatase family protein [Euryarchaeota archaeon]
MKVLLVGDTHGDAKFISSINRLAKTQGARYVMQLGDFGYDFSPNVLASIRAWLDGDERRKWYWLDGNHDQHDYIRSEIR